MSKTCQMHGSGCVSIYCWTLFLCVFEFISGVRFCQPLMFLPDAWFMCFVLLLNLFYVSLILSVVLWLLSEVNCLRHSATHSPYKLQIVPVSHVTLYKSAIPNCNDHSSFIGKVYIDENGKISKYLYVYLRKSYCGEFQFIMNNSLVPVIINGMLPR